MSTAIQIRPYDADDKESVLHLLQANTPQYFAVEEMQDLTYYLEHEIEYYYVVESNCVVIGCGGINFDHNERQAKLSWDIIHPNFQGKGIGQELLKFRLDVIPKLHSVQRVSVRTSQFVFGFYQKSGFELLYTEKDYWADGIDLYYMVLR